MRLLICYHGNKKMGLLCKSSVVILKTVLRMRMSVVPVCPSQWQYCTLLFVENVANLWPGSYHVHVESELFLLYPVVVRAATFQAAVSHIHVVGREKEKRIVDFSFAFFSICVKGLSSHFAECVKLLMSYPLNWNGGSTSLIELSAFLPRCLLLVLNCASGRSLCCAGSRSSRSKVE